MLPSSKSQLQHVINALAEPTSVESTLYLIQPGPTYLAPWEMQPT